MPSSAWKTDVCSRSEEHTSELQSLTNLVCRLLLEKKTFPNIWNDTKCGDEVAGPDRSCTYLMLCKCLWNSSSNKCYYTLGSSPFFFFNDTATTEIYTLSLHDALPICSSSPQYFRVGAAKQLRSMQGEEE